MKSNKLFVILAAALLVACSSNSKLSSASSNTDTSSNQTTESNDTSSSENSTASSESSNSSSERSSSSIESSSSSSSSSASSSSGSSSSTTTPDGTATKVVTFYNGGFKSSSLDTAKSQNEFVTWFNNGDNTLKSIGYEGYLQLNEIDTAKNTTLILGSSKSDGKLTFNFNYYIHSVKAVVQAYTKYYNNTDNNDKNATFLIDTTEYDLSIDESHTGPSERKTFTKEYSEAPKSFSISNKTANQRVFVHSLEITYYTVD